MSEIVKVPKEPTEGMMRAWERAMNSHQLGRPVWKLPVKMQAYYTIKAAIKAGMTYDEVVDHMDDLAREEPQSTNKLRFVESANDASLIFPKKRVLQQWYERSNGTGEWRDVMVVSDSEV